MPIYKCKDGKFGSSKTNCRTKHKGLKQTKPVKVTAQYLNRIRAQRSPSSREPQPKAAKMPQNGSALGVQDIPLRDLNIATHLFQNRKNHFSLRSVENIVEAVKSGAFRWSQFDPITVWVEPKSGKFYVLSGHSRTEAFTRLAALNMTVNGRGFDTIPAKVERNLSEAEAKQIALNSNTLATKETEIERADYYRKMRIQENPTGKQLELTAKRNEGDNWTRIIAYSFLNEGGKTYNALQILETAQETSSATIKVIAKWIGTARMRFSMLTNAHENELYEWLVTQKGYGTAKGQINNEIEFLQKVNNIIMKRTEFGVFDQTKPLNIANLLQKSPVEQTYDAQLADLQQTILYIEKEIKQKQQDFARRGASESEVIRLTEGLNATLVRRRKEYYELMQAKGRILEQASREKSLFDTIGYISSSGFTRCRDGKYSSYPRYKGVCSHHAGIGKIIDTRGALYLCKDGTFSTHAGRGACMRHGGLKSDRAVFANRQCFQPRKTKTADRQGDLFRKEYQGDIFEQPKEVFSIENIDDVSQNILNDFKKRNLVDENHRTYLKKGDWYYNGDNVYLHIVENYNNVLKVAFYDKNLNKNSERLHKSVRIEDAIKKHFKQIQNPFNKTYFNIGDWFYHPKTRLYGNVVSSNDDYTKLDVYHEDRTKSQIGTRGTLSIETSNFNRLTENGYYIKIENPMQPEQYEYDINEQVITKTFYADIKEGTKGKVFKRWVTPSNEVWYKLYLGKNQGGQKLYKSFPADVLAKKNYMTEPEPEPVAPVAPVIDENLQRRIDAYNEKKQNRIERYRNLANKASKESDQAYRTQKKMWDNIPFGQPILVGHHSEQRDRNYRNKAWNLMGKSVKLGEKSEYYENKANTVENSNVISSDDPLAIQKLKEKLERLKRKAQNSMRI